MISMQEELLPKPVLELFERVRQSADYMPPAQQRGVMAAELGALLCFPIVDSAC